MANIYKWLENVHPPSSPPAPSLEPMDIDHFAGVPTDQITLCNIDEDGNTYFDVPNAWRSSVEQPEAYIEPLWAGNESASIDPSLTMMDPSIPPPRNSVTVPDHLTEVNTKILIYLAKVLKVPKDLTNESTTGWTFTAEELEALEPVPEEDYALSTPSAIDGICVEPEPQLANIESVIDVKRVGSDRQTFYLAKDTNGGYYWFHPPRAKRDLRLNKLIEDYRHRARADITGRKSRGIKRLRSGRRIEI